MVSSKKERGKQRRAAKSLAAANNGGGSSNEKSIVKSIRNGQKEVTCYVANSGVPGLSFDDSGILSAVLDFLKRCENDIRLIKSWLKWVGIYPVLLRGSASS